MPRFGKGHESLMPRRDQLQDVVVENELASGRALAPRQHLKIGDAGSPSGEIGVWFKVGEVAPQADARLLKDFIRVSPVGNEAENIRIEPSPVCGHQTHKLFFIRIRHLLP